MIPMNDLGRKVPDIRDRARAALQDVFDSGWYILGSNVLAFEEAFANYCTAKHGIGVASGTDALRLALSVVGTNGSERRIWTTPNAGFYTCTAARLNGAKVGFLDIDRDTHIVSTDGLDARMKGDVLVITHLYGNTAKASLAERAQQLEMTIIEDASQAHGGFWSDGRRVGSVGDVSAFSLYPTKNLGAFGDGGILTTQSDKIATQLRSLRQYGWGEKYCVERRYGTNSRLDEMQAALLLILLEQLDAKLDRRRRIMRKYIEACADASDFEPVTRADEDASPHLAVFVTSRRSDVRQHFQQMGIATDIHFPLLDHQQKDIGDILLEDPDLPNAEALNQNILSLPLYPELTDAEVEEICAAIREL